MRKPLPSRTAILDLLKSQDHALDAREVAERLAVAPASQPGLLRMLDDLVFDGVVTARGDKFKLGTSDKVPEKTPALVAKPVQPATSTARATDPRERNPREAADRGRKGLKGLPKDAGKGAKGAVAFVFLATIASYSIGSAPPEIQTFCPPLIAAKIFEPDMPLVEPRSIEPLPLFSEKRNSVQRRAAAGCGALNGIAMMYGVPLMTASDGMTYLTVFPAFAAVVTAPGPLNDHENETL